MAVRLTGASVKRVEDPRILTGNGSYVADLHLPGMVHAAFVRSPFPHARIASIDLQEARALPGVLLVLSAAELAEHANDITPPQVPNLVAPSYCALARDKVLTVGDPVAVVVATDRYIAEDGCDLVNVDYDPIDAVTTIDQAMEADSPVLFEGAGSNVTYRDTWVYGDVDAAFTSGARVVSATFDQHRHANVPMECRGTVADYSPRTGELVVHTANQNPHAVRTMLAGYLRQPTHQIRVLCGDIGGSFGQKAGPMREDVAVCVASKLLGRPVKWIEDRSENLTIGGQARDERLEVSAAVDDQGAILGMKVRMLLDNGAYPLTYYPATGYATLVRALFTSAYRIRNFAFESVVVATNKASYIPYRGPWEAEVWGRERFLDVLARELGVDPVAFRDQNLFTDEEMPTETCTGALLTGITQRQCMTEACEHISYETFRAEQAAARSEGRYLGIGIANYIEPAPIAPSVMRAMGMQSAPRTAQAAVVRLEPDGMFTVFTSQQPHGQSHETTLAQLVADEFEVGLEQVRVIHGDTMTTPFNLVGTGGSRAANLASGATIGAARAVREKLLGVASQLMEVDPADLEVRDGNVVARGVPTHSMSIEQVARVAYNAPGRVFEDGAAGIEGTYAYVSPEGTWSMATHACTVEVDPDTGRVKILRYVVAEDCGSIINPAIVDGQVRGGVAQGIGAVLLERSAYGDDGQYLASTMMDYLLPTASDIPRIEIHHVESPPVAEVNFRGVGEGGALGAPAALTNAIEDALAPLGVQVREQHLPPSRIAELCGRA
jgi:carbon-monoxide dehydrogenase large subunit